MLFYHYFTSFWSYFTYFLILFIFMSHLFPQCFFSYVPISWNTHTLLINKTSWNFHPFSSKLSLFYTISIFFTTFWFSWFSISHLSCHLSGLIPQLSYLLIFQGHSFNTHIFGYSYYSLFRQYCHYFKRSYSISVIFLSSIISIITRSSLCLPMCSHSGPISC